MSQPTTFENQTNFLQMNGNLQAAYPDVYTPEALTALAALAPFNREIKAAMAARTQRRADRYQQQKKITFLDPASYIPRTKVKVQDARDGKFEGAEIPADLQRQWIQGTGPAAKRSTSAASRSTGPTARSPRLG